MTKFSKFLIVFILVLTQARAKSKALHCDGSDYLTINHGSNSLTGTFTIEFWAKPSLT